MVCLASQKVFFGICDLGRNACEGFITIHPSPLANATTIKQKYPTNQMSVTNPIVIVGLGNCFPGAQTPAAFWHLIQKSANRAREMPRERSRLPIDQLYQAGEPSPDKVIGTHGCFVDHQALELDYSKLALKPELVEALDPCFKLGLYAASQAWLETQTASVDPSRVGVILGNIVLPTERATQLTRDFLGRAFTEKVTGNLPPLAGAEVLPLDATPAGLPAAIIARALRISGTSYCLDAACASSLFALNLAIEELHSGRADAMITGAISRPDCLYTQMGFSQLRALSPNGLAAPFDARGNGLVVGEGAGMFVLKRLQDALRAKDRIYAVIEGLGLSNDTDGSLLAPSSEGQLRAMRAAYQQAGWRISDLDLIECHATGTPLGDRVELQSLQSLWQDQDYQPGQCVIGSVKGTVGHLLTAAGSASLMKVILAMEHKQFPPTSNFQSAQIELSDSPFQILTSPQPWQSADRPRRAAVSAFGFGGTNAHVLLSQWQGQIKASEITTSSAEPPAVAVVGLGAHLGPWQNVAQLTEHIIGDAAAPSKSEGNWWGLQQSSLLEGFWPDKGFLINDLNLPLGPFHIPPNELKEMLPQQLLLLMVAHQALESAQFDRAQKNRCGCFVGIGLDLNTTNYCLRWELEEQAAQWNKELNLKLDQAALTCWVAKLKKAVGPALNANRVLGGLGGLVGSRVAREYRIGGPCISFACEEGSGLRALEAGLRSIQRGELDSALVGAVDLASDLRSLLAQHKLGNQTLVGEGATAVVLKPLQDAQRDGDTIYAVLKGIGSAAGPLASADRKTYRTAMERALQDAQLKPDQIQYLESNLTETAGFLSIFGTHHPIMGKATIGAAGAATGLASVLKVILALHHKTLPAYLSEKPASIDDPNGYLMPHQPRHWLRNRNDGPRRAAVSTLSLSGRCDQVILEDFDQQPATTPLPPMEETLIPLYGQTSTKLAEQCQTLHSWLGSHQDWQIQRLGEAWWRLHQQQNQAHCLVLRACSSQELAQLALLAQDYFSHPDEENTELFNLQIEKGSLYWRAEPLGKDAAVAFVFPGSGSHYHDMARQIALRWPQPFHDQDLRTLFLADELRPDLFWGKKPPANITQNHQALLSAQVSLDIAMANLLRSFNIHPSGIVGYSLGEAAGLFASNAWRDHDAMHLRTKESDLFCSVLANECSAVREYWQLADHESVDWSVGVISHSAEDVRALLKDQARVYLLIINTPRECVIGGNRAAVRAFAKQIKSRFFPLSGIVAVHCEVMSPVKERYYEHHLFETHVPAGMRFYSGASGAEYSLSRESAANSITAQALHGIDFPKTIRSAYADGFRFFIEMGPGTSCSRMIREILKDQSFHASSACQPAASADLQMLHFLASLMAEGLPVNLDPLFTRQTAGQDPPLIQIPMSGGPFQDTAPPAPTEVPPVHEAIQSEPSQDPGQSTQDWAAQDTVAEMIEHQSALLQAQLGAHESFLKYNSDCQATMARTMSHQNDLLARLQGSSVPLEASLPHTKARPAFDREMCLEFARGSLANVLGSEWAEIDSYPTRVRLPDEPLMLVDRIVEIGGTTMKDGHITTEHDVLHDGWYLDGNRIATCIAIEAGQADLFLSAFLGVDFKTRGLAVYRLLDAKVTFHSDLPKPGETITYDIFIDRFFRQGDTHFFRFRFDGQVEGRPLLSMREGVAGYFSPQELSAGKGIVRASKAKDRARKDPNCIKFVSVEPESYDSAQMAALRRGDLEGCFGAAFSGLPLRRPLTLPEGRMNLVDRVTALDPDGGAYGMGMITAEMDIQPDDWFLTCHFKGDKVMPGTLMYECCLHSMRVYLMRHGWVGEASDVICQPVLTVASNLLCRGQVLETTKTVTYEVHIREMGYNPEPYCIGDAYMYSDSKCIVDISEMSVRFGGLSQAKLETIWAERQPAQSDSSDVVMSYPTILALATGKPSEFGDRYAIFDKDRKIARFPRPPYLFMSRVTRTTAQRWTLADRVSAEVEYDVPPEAWYFEADRQPVMPYAILQEVALQSCGWMAAYMGCALLSSERMLFRNLGGNAVVQAAVGRNTGRLTTAVKVTKYSKTRQVILLFFEFEVLGQGQMIYKGDTYFGFFTETNMAKQVGVSDQWYTPTETEHKQVAPLPYPNEAPYPRSQMRMLDQILFLLPKGGTYQQGFIEGAMDVSPDLWFFKAHFYQDPVWPGSLGLEAFQQLLKVYAGRLWDLEQDSIFQSTGARHTWIYRGQVSPSNRRVCVQANIKRIDQASRTLIADGYLKVDGVVIYQIKDFGITLCLPANGQKA